MHTELVEVDQEIANPVGWLVEESVEVAESCEGEAPKLTEVGAPVIVTVCGMDGVVNASENPATDGPTELVAITRILYEVP